MSEINNDSRGVVDQDIAQEETPNSEPQEVISISSEEADDELVVRTHAVRPMVMRSVTRT